MNDLPSEAPENIDLQPGDVFVLLTDGFYEYQNTQGRQMGKDRVGQIIGRLADQPATQILQALMAETAAFAQEAPQLDDLTALIVKRV